VRGISKRTALTKAALGENSYEVWNAFIDLIATSFEHELTPLQRSAQLVFRYESEVQNGGHLQFFSNGTGEDADETIAALDALGASAQARVLDQAVARWKAPPRPEFVSDYSQVESKHEFQDLDRAFSDCPSPLTEALERHLAEHEAEYVVRK
jgi:hypothetical protein